MITKGEQELNLRLFVKYVENGKTPPAYLLKFIADGVNEFLKDGKPWQSKSGRPRKGQSNGDALLDLVKIYVLSRMNIERARLLDLAGNPSSRTLPRHIQSGREYATERGTGDFLVKWAIDELLADERLKRSEREQLRIILNNMDEDNREPSYT